MGHSAAITLTRDEVLVLLDYLARWAQTTDYTLPLDGAERAAFIRLWGYLEKADDGTIFSADYIDELAAAKARLEELYPGYA